MLSKIADSQGLKASNLTSTDVWDLRFNKLLWIFVSLKLFHTCKTPSRKETIDFNNADKQFVSSRGFTKLGD